MAENTDILIVGAGPIGLIHAFALNRLHPDLHIEILEKYATYQRDHTLSLQHKQLEALMRATHSEKVPELVALLNKLKINSHIRTNELQTIFTTLISDSKNKKNVILRTEQEVTSEQIKPMLEEEYPNVKLLIGADGTHSTVSNSLFPKGNQVEHEFDYVLQLRYNIEGEAKAKGINTLDFYQQMAIKGLVGNEYTGNFENGKTPVTMQMMISKEDFDFLNNNKVTSKHPLTPLKKEKQGCGFQRVNSFTFDELEKSECSQYLLSEDALWYYNKFTNTLNALPLNQEQIEEVSKQFNGSIIPKLSLEGLAKITSITNHFHREQPELPAHLDGLIRQYLVHKIKDTDKETLELDRETIRISVNKAPATHAKKLVTKHGEITVLLVGDAALGLSYFKGLNAGLEAAAKLFSLLWNTKFKDMDKAFATYETWFLSEFSPKKVKEVEQYSTWQVRAPMQVMKKAAWIKGASVQETDATLEKTLENYFNYYKKDNLTADKEATWNPFPHRKYGIINFWQLLDVPLKHTAKKIAKNFIDYFKPYKSKAQIAQDYKLPFLGGYQVLVALLIKIPAAIFTFNFFRLVDAFLTVFRGGIEIASALFSWFVKPITRGIATYFNGGFKSIEDNKGMQQLARIGEGHLSDRNLSLSDSYTKYRILAVSNDLHRKFNKSLDRGEKTKLGVNEALLYNAIHNNTEVDKEKLTQYFALFSQTYKRSNQVLTEENPLNSSQSLKSGA
ncbi:MAG: hypothetical protein WC785_04105 [Tatlockia sp.]|jgi:2-polyprenyl-6-methoxyphenol hydroxylase-like FAD-dependent oxidoreductase